MLIPFLPDPPLNLTHDDVALQFVRIVPGDPVRGFVPFYHFRIVLPTGADAGHLNLRIGQTDHVFLYAGQIGYEVFEAYRGSGYAAKACRAVATFARVFYTSVVITCDPENMPSRRTIERLGAEFVGEIAVPAEDPHYAGGSRVKRRYIWRL